MTTINFLNNLDSVPRKTKQKETVYVSHSRYFGYVTKSDADSMFTNMDGSIRKKLVIQLITFFSHYYMYTKDQISDCPVVEICTHDKFFPNWAFVSRLKKKAEEFGFITLYDSSYVPSKAPYNPKTYKNKIGFDKKNERLARKGKQMVTYGKSKSYVLNVQAVKVLFDFAYKHNLIKTLKPTTSNKDLPEKSILSFDDIEKIVGTELGSHMCLHGVSFNDIVSYFMEKNPEIKELQQFDDWYNSKIKQLFPEHYELLKRKTEVSVKSKNGAVKSCAVRTTSKFCNTFTIENLKKKHPKWTDGQVQEYITKNLKKHRESIVRDVVSKLGLEYGTDVVTYDVTSSVSKLLHCKHTGEYEKGDCYEKIFRQFTNDVPNAVFTDEMRSKIKTFVNRVIFSRENMLYQNLSYSGSYKRLYQLCKKDEIKLHTLKLQKCIFDYLGKNNSNQLFLDESYIMVQMMLDLMEMDKHCVVLQIYDELIVIKKNIRVNEEGWIGFLNKSHEKHTVKYYR